LRFLTKSIPILSLKPWLINWRIGSLLVSNV
jgi:hypothetical protein